MGFLLQGTISKPPPELEKNYICPLQMPCYSRVIPVVETGHAGSREARGVSVTPAAQSAAEYRTDKTILLFLFRTKEKQMKQQISYNPEKMGFLWFDPLYCLYSKERKRGNSNQLNAFSASSGSQQPLNLCPDHQPRTPCLFRRADLLVVCPDPTGTW